MNQLTMLGGRFNEKMAPYAEGNILVTKPFGRVVVMSVSDNIHGAVLICTRLDNGNECVVLEREIEYRAS